MSRSDQLTEDERFEYPRRVSEARQKGRAFRCENYHDSCAVYPGGPCATQIVTEIEEEYGE